MKYANKWLSTILIVLLAFAPLAFGQVPVVQLTVRTYDGSNNNSEIYGYFAVLYKMGIPVAAGFSPIAFSLISGQEYVIQVQDYDRMAFWYWIDTGDPITSRDRPISITSDTQVNAFYINIDNPPPGYSYISVSTTEMNGDPMPGYYTTLWQDGEMLRHGFTPYQFVVSNSQTYQVAVADHGTKVFDHWDDGSTERFRTVTTGIGSTINLVAVYRTIP